MNVPVGAQTRPRVTVLMATFNGSRWLDAQIDSVLGQRGVDVRLLVSDDGSKDGTQERIAQRAHEDPRICLLPKREGTPGVTGNFLHLFLTHVPDGSYVAFCDQDDLWHADKLERQIGIALASGADAVSSNVLAFGPNGHRSLIVKSRPQRRWDHVFEAAGPGSTYLFTPALHARLRELVMGLDYSQIGVHDWYLYALARALGAQWHIDETPTVDYRQHEANVQGANAGTAAMAARVSKLRNGFYRRQFILTARTVDEVGVFGSAEREDLHRLIHELENNSVLSKIRFLRRWPQIRRSRKEGVELALSRLIGIW